LKNYSRNFLAFYYSFRREGHTSKVKLTVNLSINMKSNARLFCRKKLLYKNNSIIRKIKFKIAEDESHYSFKRKSIQLLALLKTITGKRKWVNMEFWN